MVTMDFDIGTNLRDDGLPQRDFTWLRAAILLQLHASNGTENGAGGLELKRCFCSFLTQRCLVDTTIHRPAYGRGIPQRTPPGSQDPLFSTERGCFHSTIHLVTTCPCFSLISVWSHT
jgi:hypothetical protein